MVFYYIQIIVFSSRTVYVSLHKLLSIQQVILEFQVGVELLTLACILRITHLPARFAGRGIKDCKIQQLPSHLKANN